MLSVDGFFVMNLENPWTKSPVASDMKPMKEFFQNPLAQLSVYLFRP